MPYGIRDDVWKMLPPDEREQIAAAAQAQQPTPAPPPPQPSPQSPAPHPVQPQPATDALVPPGVRLAERPGVTLIPAPTRAANGGQSVARAEPTSLHPGNRLEGQRAGLSPRVTEKTPHNDRRGGGLASPATHQQTAQPVATQPRRADPTAAIRRLSAHAQVGAPPSGSHPPFDPFLLSPDWLAVQAFLSLTPAARKKISKRAAAIADKYDEARAVRDAKDRGETYMKFVDPGGALGDAQKAVRQRIAQTMNQPTVQAPASRDILDDLVRALQEAEGRGGFGGLLGRLTDL